MWHGRAETEITNVMMYKLLNRKFQTPLGDVICELKCTHNKYSVLSEVTNNFTTSITIRTASSIITVNDFKIPSNLILKQPILNTNGWTYQIEKLNDDVEDLIISCRLIPKYNDLEFDIATGENLDAIEASNEEFILHIGTEDGQTLRHRSLNNDWMPIRFAEDLINTKLLYGLINDGFETIIPNLNANEKLYIHFLCAIGNKIENNISTWIAVDQDKNDLEANINIQTI